MAHFLSSRPLDEYSNDFEYPMYTINFICEVFQITKNTIQKFT